MSHAFDHDIGRTSECSHDDRILLDRSIKSTPRYGFRKVLKIFGDEGYQTTKNELKSTYLEEDALTCYHGRTFYGISESKHEGNLCS